MSDIEPTKTKLEIKESLIQRARAQYGEILYCGEATCWGECFTHEDDEICFWFNDKNGATHMIGAPYKKKG